MTTSRDDEIRPLRGAPDPASVGDVVNLVKTYAQQETIGPIKNAGRWLAMGAAGAFTMAVGIILMLLGLLRLIQVEWDRSARGSFSWLSYVIVLAVAAAVIALAASRIKKDTLDKPRK